MSLVIVRADKRHVGQVAPLFNEYRRFCEQPSDLAGARRFIRKRLENHESVIFLALLDGSPVGFAQLYPSFTSVYMKPIWILNDLFVTEKARGHGVATALLEKSNLLARRTRARGLVLETARHNLTARRLYESRGWKQDKVLLTYRLKV